METLITSPFFVGYILPFVLIFTVIFAILQKSGILGKNKKQVDALVGLVVGLIVISFANAVGIINSLLPFMAVAIVIILIFLILISMFSIKGDNFELPPALRNAGIGLSALAVAIAVLVVTGAWDYILARWFSGSGSGLANFVFLIVVLGVIGVLIFPNGKKE